MSHIHHDRDGVTPGRKGAGRRLPLPDARRVLAGCWPSPEFWISVLDDPDWWLTYNLPPAHIAPPKLRIRIMITNVQGVGLICPIDRPASCDRRYPQQWHARRHTTDCPYVSPAPKMAAAVREGFTRRTGVAA